MGFKEAIEGGTIPDEAKPAMATAADPTKQWADRWQTLSAETFTTKPAPRDWLFKTQKGDGVFPVGRVGMLLAEGGAGKTMAVAQLAISVATRASWLGAFTIPQAGRVLLILGEEDQEEVQRRLYNAGQALELNHKQIGDAARIVALPLQGVPCAMVTNDVRGNVEDAEFLKWLRVQLATPSADPWRLIVVDPLSRFAGLDAEKDNAAATRFIQALESLATQTGAALIVAHHTNKTSRKEPGADTSSSRGASALTDGVRWVAQMSVERVTFANDEDKARRLGRIVTLAVTKSNYALHPPKVTLRYADTHGGALLPLDKTDEGFVNEAKKKQPKKDNSETTESADTRTYDVDD